MVDVVQVEGTHPYTGEDTDELSFEAGDVINVIPFEDPEDQVSESNGMFSQMSLTKTFIDNRVLIL